MARSDIDIEWLALNINQAQSPVQLMNRTFDFFRSMGAKSIIYHLLPPFGAKEIDPVGRIAWWGFPIEWARKYSEERFFEINPIIRKGLLLNRPYRWSDIRNEHDLSTKEQFFLDQMNEFELGDGIAIPVYGANGFDGNMAIGFGGSTVSLPDSQLFWLQIISQLAHQRYCEILEVIADKKVTFSGRELEIMRWMASGKSNSVIADILGISSHTVDTYLRRIYGKLDVSNRVSATLRGMSAGLLS